MSTFDEQPQLAPGEALKSLQEANAVMDILLASMRALAQEPVPVMKAHPQAAEAAQAAEAPSFDV